MHDDPLAAASSDGPGWRPQPYVSPQSRALPGRVLDGPAARQREREVAAERKRRVQEQRVHERSKREAARAKALQEQEHARVQRLEEAAQRKDEQKQRRQVHLRARMKEQKSAEAKARREVAAVRLKENEAAEAARLAKQQLLQQRKTEAAAAQKQQRRRKPFGGQSRKPKTQPMLPIIHKPQLQQPQRSLPKPRDKVRAETTQARSSLKSKSGKAKRTAVAGGAQRSASGKSDFFSEWFSWKVGPVQFNCTLGNK